MTKVLFLYFKVQKQKKSNKTCYWVLTLGYKNRLDDIYQELFLFTFLWKAIIFQVQGNSILLYYVLVDCKNNYDLFYVPHAIGLSK